MAQMQNAIGVSDSELGNLTFEALVLQVPGGHFLIFKKRKFTFSDTQPLISTLSSYVTVLTAQSLIRVMSICNLR